MKRKSKGPPDPTAGQIERLALVRRELEEVRKTAERIRKWGFKGQHPDQPRNNREDFERDVGHLAHAVMCMVNALDVTLITMSEAMFEKAANIERHRPHPDTTSPDEDTTTAPKTKTVTGREAVESTWPPSGVKTLHGEEEE